MADASTVPSMLTRRRLNEERLDAVMPVAPVGAPEAAASHPNWVQSAAALWAGDREPAAAAITNSISGNRINGNRITQPS
jgi:hypothetical protein